MPFALTTFAIFATLALDRPRPWLAGFCALCAALLRADGALWAGLVLLAAWIVVMGVRRSELRCRGNSFTSSPGTALAGPGDEMNELPRHRSSLRRTPIPAI